MPPHKKRIPPFGDDARRRAVISGLAGHLSQARDAIWQKADACGLSGSTTHVRLPSGRRHAERSRRGRRNPEHARYRGAADVGVEHPDARATLKRRELINGTACALPCPPSPQVQKSAAISALPDGANSGHWHTHATEVCTDSRHAARCASHRLAFRLRSHSRSSPGSDHE